MISEKFIQTPKTARYYILGKPSKKIKKVWFVFHGYGQLGKEFLLNFEAIKSENCLIVAPEALNKFYLRGFNGKIGATWMTKENRENEIDDYVKMISDIYTELESSLDLSKAEINVLGFSQGTHTAVRWLHNTNTKVDNLILWSGLFPHDCDYKKNINYWSAIKIKIVFGNKDRLVDRNKFEEELQYFNRQMFITDLITFNGGHEMNENQLLDIFNSI